MKPYATFDRAKFPLVIVTFTGAKETPDNFQAYLDGLLANYDRKEPFGLVFDASRAGTPNPSYQLKQARWMKQHQSLIETYCRGIAYVVPGKVQRHILQLIFKLQNNPVPFQVFATLDEGKAWAQLSVK